MSEHDDLFAAMDEKAAAMRSQGVLGLYGGWEGHEMRNDPLPVRRGDLQIAFASCKSAWRPNSAKAANGSRYSSAGARTTKLGSGSRRPAREPYVSALCEERDQLLLARKFLPQDEDSLRGINDRLAEIGRLTVSCLEPANVMQLATSRMV